MVCNDYGNNNQALIYHPKQKYGCSSLEFCEFDHKRQVYVRISKNDYYWLNLTKQADRSFQSFHKKEIKEINYNNMEKKLKKIKKIVSDI
jgi:hypothetical protein